MIQLPEKATRPTMYFIGVTTTQSSIMKTFPIWAEALGGCPDRLDRYDGKEIREIMERMPGWRRAKDKRMIIRPYGIQRFYERRANP